MRLSRPLTLVAGTVLAGAILTGTAGSALAYDCFNSSRSAQGNTAAAAHSDNWYSVPEFLVAVGFTSDQVAAVMPTILADTRIPANFTVFYNDKHDIELAQKMREDLAVNGTGIDHSDDYSTPVFDAIFSDVTSVLFGG